MSCIILLNTILHILDKKRNIIYKIGLKFILPFTEPLKKLMKKSANVELPYHTTHIFPLLLIWTVSRLLSRLALWIENTNYF